MRKLNFALLVGALLFPIQGFALGLGSIQVNSTLNQKLDARIDVLSAVPEDAEFLIVKLASREAFSKAGIDRPHDLTSLKFRTVVQDERVYITVKSPGPQREPSLNFLIEIDWPKGHLIRQYTILLEPPEFMRKLQSQKNTSTSNRPAMRGETRTEPSSVETGGFRPAELP